MTEYEQRKLRFHSFTMDLDIPTWQKFTEKRTKDGHTAAFVIRKLIDEYLNDNGKKDGTHTETQTQLQQPKS